MTTAYGLWWNDKGSHQRVSVRRQGGGQRLQSRQGINVAQQLEQSAVTLAQHKLVQHQPRLPHVQWHALLQGWPAHLCGSKA